LKSPNPDFSLHKTQLLHDIEEARKIRVSADRLDIRGDHATALLFRNAAWRIEQKRDWLDDAKSSSKNNAQETVVGQ
jgi:hypothetical protein